MKYDHDAPSHVICLLLKLHDRFVKLRVFPDSVRSVELFAKATRILSMDVLDAWYFPPQLW